MTVITIPPLSPFPGRGAAPEDYIAQADTTMQELPGVIGKMNEVSAALNLGASVLQNGYLPPVLYAAGLSITVALQTVEHAGATYAPLLSALPFTTSGVFEADKFRVIQGVTAAELAADSGAARVNFEGTMLDVVLRGLPAPVELFGADPSGIVDSSTAFVNASNAGVQIVCTGSYLLNNLPDSMDWRRFSGSGTAQIKSRLFTFAYIERPRLSFNQVRGMIAHAQSSNIPVSLAFFGDSLVDGANTTGVVENPVDGAGRAIGTTNHTAAAPKAFCNKLLGLFQEYAAAIGVPNRVNVWNAGYSSRSIATGWANENYERAVVLNPNYGYPHAVGIEFAINDSHTSPSNGPIDPAIFGAELGKLMAKIQGYGAVPFLITPPEIFSISGYDSRTIRSIYDEVKIGMGRAGRNLTILDMGAAVTRWFNVGADVNGPSDAPLSAGYRTASLFYQMAQAGLADRTHPADRTHAFKAGYLFSELAPNILNAAAAVHESIPATDYRWRLRVIDAGSGTGVQTNQLTQHGGNVVALPSGYNPGEPWSSAWIWNDQPDAFLVYRAGDINGHISGNPFIAPPHACVMQVVDKTSGIFLYQEGLPNDGVAPLVSALSADRPHVICQLTHGLNFVQLFAPLVNTYNYYPGALEIVSGLDWGYGADTWSDYVVSKNLIEDCGTIFKTQTTGVRSYGVKESRDGANWVGFGRTGKTTSILIEAEMTGTATLGVVCGAGLTHRRVNGGLYRDNDNQIKLVLFAEKFDGTIGIALMATFAYTKTGMQRLRVDLGRVGNNQVITLYDGWGAATQIGQWTSDNSASTTICWPWAGHFGDHHVNGPATLECQVATATFL